MHGRVIPEAQNFSPQRNDNDIVTLVDVDFTAYRKAHDNRMVRRNVTVPSWLNEKAEKAGINVSGVYKSLEGRTAFGVNHDIGKEKICIQIIRK